jgi:hypothetical protein
MSRSPLFLFVVAFACTGGAAAFADRAALSVGTGGASFKIEADDVDEPATVVAGPVAEENADPFVPDVYPSREQAARAAAERWARAASGRQRPLPPTARAMCPQDLVGPFDAGLHAALPDLRVEPCDGTLCTNDRAPSNELWLYVDESTNNRPGNWKAGGTITVRAKGASGDSAMTRFVDKPWLTDFAAFTTRTPGRWVVARSDPDRPAGSSSEASQDARVSAAEQVTPLVMARLDRRFRGWEGDVRRLVEVQLLGDRMVYDRFPQKYERPYGTLYREAVLLDASDPQLERLADEVRWSMQSERQSKVKGFVSAAAVLLVTYALYRFANAFTRGYFTWSLRTAAALAAAGAVVLIVAVA